MATPGFSYCAGEVRAHDRERFLTLQFTPPARREALLALYAFNIEVAKIHEIVSEPMLGQVRLQWWREAIDEAYGGVLRPHEVMQALGPCIAEHQLSRCYFDRLLDAREADLDDRPLPTMAALQDYAEATSSTLGWLALEILGASGDAARTAVGHVGAAWALSGLLRALPLHLKAKRIYLPRDLTLRHGLDPQALVAPPAAQAGARPLCNVVAEIADTARLHLSAARALRPEVEAAALPMLLPAVISRHHLRRLARAGHDPFSRSLPQPVALSR